ncbi:MFS transporter [Nocardia sp. NPDC057668]|uniref:MFS transporter n=1 Tax=Nocardia sp. NPDC057668 TaxID=3346202 RepID=UPI00366CF6C1
MNETGDVPASTAPLGRNREFRLLWIGQAVSMLGARVVAVATPLVVLRYFHSPALAGIAAFVAFLPGVTIQLPAGVWVDRWDRRRVMIAAESGRLIAFTSLAVAGLAGLFTPAHLLAVLLAEGVARTFFGLAEFSALPMVVARTHITTALSRNEIRTRVATLLGPGVAGVLFSIGSLLPFVFGALSALVACWSSYLLRGPLTATASANAHRGMRDDLAEGMRWMRRNPFFLWSAVIISGYGIVGMGFPLAATLQLQALGASPGYIGFALGALGFGGLIGAALAPRIIPRSSTSTVIIAVPWAIGASLLLATAMPTPLLFAFWLPPVSIAAVLMNVALGAARLHAIPEHLRARVAGVTGMICAPGPLGALLVGFTTALWSTRAAMLVLACGMLVVACAALACPDLGEVDRPPT